MSQQMILAPQSLKEEIEKLKAENEQLKHENEQLKNDISEYEKCIPEHYDIAYPHNIQNIVDEFEATIDGLKTEVWTLEEEKKESEEGLYKCDDHLTLLQRWIDYKEEDGYYYPDKEFIDKVYADEKPNSPEQDNFKKRYYELYDIVDYSKEDIDYHFTCRDRHGVWVRLKDGRECRDND